jgi:glycosyltransferase involved in cell wall biosynthesis
MICSICIATYNKAVYLDRCLESIFRQCVDFSFEVIVVDDGSVDNTPGICTKYPVKYIKIDRAPSYRNPSVARNVAARAAKGERLIHQSDDVEHQGDAINGLIGELQAGEFVIATVYNMSLGGKPVHRPLYEFTGAFCKRPFFFLGACWRSDFYAIGGNCEEFVAPGWDDNYLADCLIKGRGLSVRYLNTVIGHHLDHPRSPTLAQDCEPSHYLYLKKVQAGIYTNESWPLS